MFSTPRPYHRPQSVSPYHLTPSSRALLNLRSAQIRRHLADRRAAREQLRTWGAA